MSKMSIKADNLTDFEFYADNESTKRGPGAPRKYTTEEAKRLKIKKNRESRQEHRNVDIPAVVNEERRKQCANDPILFFTTYLPNWFPIAFSPVHLQVVELFMKVLTSGDIATVILPRGSGKTTLAKALLMWCILNKAEQFVVLITADSKGSKRALDDIKNELLNNDLLYEDYPEICSPVRMIDSVVQRASVLAYDGLPLQMKWSSDEIRLPLIKNCVNSGNIIVCTSIGGQIRGLQKKHIITGKIIRPSCVYVDDLVKDDEAKSEDIQDQISETFTKAVLNLTSHSKSMGVLITGTIVADGDTMSRWSDTEKNAHMHPIKFPAVSRWPKNMKLWETYFDMRHNEDLNNDVGHNGSNNFYHENQVQLLEDFDVYWNIYNENEFSGQQHFMNLYHKLGKDAFDVEYMHTPALRHQNILGITKDTVLNAYNGKNVFQCSDNQKIITVGCDINTSKGISWVMLASSMDSNSSVIAHGIFSPFGNYIYDAKRSVKTEEECLKIALLNFFENINDIQITSVSGEQRKITGISVDVGYLPKVIFEVFKELNVSKKYSFALVPVRGRANHQFGDGGKDIVRKGYNWSVAKWTQCNVLVSNVDYWKENVHKSFFLPVVTPGSLNINANKNTITSYFDYATHICNEQLRQKQHKHNVLEYKWQEVGPNDYLDATVYSRILASYFGTIQPEIDSKIQITQQKITNEQPQQIEEKKQQKFVVVDNSFDYGVNY